MSGKRIVIVGVTGAGKTTLARRLASHLEIPHVELDALYWEPGWQAAPLELFRQRVSEALRGDAWIVDGNYSRVRDLVWPAADTLIWLDYPLPLTLWRLVRRSVARVASQDELWNSNRESWRALLGRNSIILWALRTHAPQRRDYPRLLSQPEHSHLRVYHLRSPREVERLLGAHVR